MLSDRIQKALTSAGLIITPHDQHVKLIDLGLDSLTLALLIIELEREFQVKIPVIPLPKEKFESMNTIESYLVELGAQ